jgi:hypothetical protein
MGAFISVIPIWIGSASNISVFKKTGSAIAAAAYLAREEDS